jgi:hypothetical protein
MTDHTIASVQHKPPEHVGVQHASVYCYNGQSEAVRDLLQRAGSLAAIHVVTKPEQLRGLEKFVFLHVKDHSASIHEELWAMLANQKATVVEIDNSRVPA